ncbi:methyl-accepting chemotaxis protein [Algicola sagamiensis]|nr:methyl-accepting chemotaxis protein [Algicola sagamiensis]
MVFKPNVLKELFGGSVSSQNLQHMQELEAKVSALNDLQTVVEFNLDGTVITANDNFLKLMGYRLDEIKNKHHRMFIDAEFKKSAEYHEFWKNLARGESTCKKSRYVTKGGRELFVQTSYKPILDHVDGRPNKVIMHGLNITEQENESRAYHGLLNAINHSQAVIEFNMDGTIITANDNFLNAVGYTLDEIKGKHHKMFVNPEERDSNDYAEFWNKLNQGEFQSAEYQRVAKGDRPIWLQASYNPILDDHKVPQKVIKFATLITEQKQQSANFISQIDAISKSQAVIEFYLDGTIISANENFLNAMGYTLDEVKGQHHRMFVDPQYANSPEYKKFWEDLKQGKFDSGEYQRFGKGGKEIWIQASYNPVFDIHGRPFKVVKYASDVTDQKMQRANFQGQLDAISKAQAVIEFNMDGTIITANDNFLNAMGYSLVEIQGHHHRMFVEESYGKSPEYQAFWDKLNRGEYMTNEFQRYGKGNKEIWIQASYNPIFDMNGKPFKVVKYATDITAQKLENANTSGQINAISKAQAVIEFNMDGTIITANENFLNAMGYTLEEIQGQHHRMFVDSKYGKSQEYKAFWDKLGRGEYEANEYQRFGKGGKEIWIQASYNPIFDLNGKPYKVVKYASDITAQKMRNADVAGQLEAIGKAQAVIEFNMDGTIHDANENFLNAMGYSLDEIKGQHHRMFVSSRVANSPEYKAFWERLNRGEYESNEYQRFGKNGKEIWIQASYNPILDINGKPYKVVKYATDITAQKLQFADFSGQISAIDKAQAVIEFNMDGTIVDANENFLSTVGYTLDEIKGKHHRMFVDPKFAESAEYKAFWEKLGRGEYEADEYRRFGKGNQEIWIQASYNPILDVNGRPFKIVKYATDVTAQKLQFADFSGQLEAIGKAQAVIEFNMDGTILTANENFLKTVGYSLKEIQGKHHRIFVEDEFANSAEYKAFWEKLNRGEYESNEYKRVGKGGNEIWIQASYNPIMDVNGKPFKVVKYATDITQQKQEAAESQKVSLRANALAVCQANVMLANNNMEIVYINEENMKMLKNRERELQKVLPNFDSQKLIGTNVDIFHKNPSHQRRMIGNLNDVFKTEIKVEELTFGLIATPWLDMNGERVGTIIEWNDRTSEVMIEKQIDHLVESASRGDFTQAIDLSDKDGFFKVLSQRLNSLMETTNEGINDVLRVLGAMARGDLTENITRDYEGAFGQLKTDVNDTVNKLTDVIGKIREASIGIQSNANEIASGSTDLSARTEQQASSLEETASSMEEMTSTVKQSSDNAQHANSLSKEAQEKAADGGTVVERAINAMTEINEASKKISDIIGVIDEIAFQTNLLALNAAVEAARAGEQGRGFAVVAGEVRNLAQRSASAAKEIKDLIRDSVNKVEDGSRLVNESGETLNEIVDSVKKVSEIIAEVSQAAEEQTMGIEQVNQAIAQMDNMTQQNSALVEETSAATENMAQESQGMVQLMSFFSIGQGHTSAVPTAPRAPVASAPEPAISKPAKVATKKVAPPKAEPANSGGLAMPDFNDNDEEWEDF